MDKFESIAGEILKTVCESDEILKNLDMDLFETNYLDSFAILDIVVEIEERFNIKVKANSINKSKVRSVNEFTKFLRENVK